ncbi:MAG: putative immunity protein [Thomasclavelia sp.]
MLGLSTVHAKKHAMDLIFYELSAIVYKNHDNYYEAVSKKIKYYLDRLFYYQDNVDKIERKWAQFLLK